MGRTLEKKIEVEALVTGTPVPYRPARINCPVEDSCPAEGGYAEDVQVFLTRENRHGETEYLNITEWISKQDLDNFSDELMEDMYDSL